MSYRVNIATIDHKDQRYATVGDWYQEGGVLQLRVSKFGKHALASKYEFLVAIHELIEHQLCKYYGVTEAQVDAWDLMHEDSEDPGSLPGCLYGAAHTIATSIEMVLAQKLGLDWNAYGEAVERLFDNAPAVKVTDPKPGHYFGGAKTQAEREADMRTKIEVRPRISK